MEPLSHHPQPVTGEHKHFKIHSYATQSQCGTGSGRGSRVCKRKMTVESREGEGDDDSKVLRRSTRGWRRICRMSHKSFAPITRASVIRCVCFLWASCICLCSPPFTSFHIELKHIFVPPSDKESTAESSSRKRPKLISIMAIVPVMKPAWPVARPAEAAATVKTRTEQATQALQAVDITPKAPERVRGSTVRMSIPLDSAERPATDSEQPRPKTPTQVHTTYGQHKLIRRDSLDRREALLKGKEGSRQRRRWENGK